MKIIMVATSLKTTQRLEKMRSFEIEGVGKGELKAHDSNQLGLV